MAGAVNTGHEQYPVANPRFNRAWCAIY